jgi:hypothetical protein
MVSVPPDMHDLQNKVRLKVHTRSELTKKRLHFTPA